MKSSSREKVTIEELAQDTWTSFAHIVIQNLAEALTEEGEWEALCFSCTMEELKTLLRRNIRSLLSRQNEDLTPFQLAAVVLD